MDRGGVLGCAAAGCLAAAAAPLTCVRQAATLLGDDATFRFPARFSVQIS